MKGVATKIRRGNVGALVCFDFRRCVLLGFLPLGLCRGEGRPFIILVGLALIFVAVPITVTRTCTAVAIASVTATSSLVSTVAFTSTVFLFGVVIVEPIVCLLRRCFLLLGRLVEARLRIQIDVDS